MDVKEALLKRRSVRKFTSDKINQEVIDELMHAAMSGPSSANKQPWDFFVIRNKEVLDKLKEATPYSKYDAPLAIIVCGNEEKALAKPNDTYWIQDCSAATQNMLLRAVELGLGSVWCGVYPQIENEQRVRDILTLPNHLRPLNIIYFGYPAMETKPTDFYTNENVHYLD